jgi:putative transcriptional regulator
MAAENAMDSLEGHLLLASPSLLDQNFVRTVVLLIQHNEDGALGLVLNRPTSKTVQELWHQVGESPCSCQRPVYLGGPVSGPLMAIHGKQDLAEIEIVSGIFFAAKKHNLDQLVNHDDLYKVFIGHAGWGPGQLEGEIDQGAWSTTPATSDDVFDDGEDLWLRLMRRAESSSLQAMLNIKHVPPDVSLN